MRYDEIFSPRLGEHTLFRCSPTAYVQGVVNHYRALLAKPITDRTMRELRAGRAFIANATSSTTTSEFASVMPSGRKEIANIVGDLLGKIDAAILKNATKSVSKPNPFDRWPESAAILNLI